MSALIAWAQAIKYTLRLNGPMKLLYIGYTIELNEPMVLYYIGCMPGVLVEKL
jgi:hypothetical protein